LIIGEGWVCGDEGRALEAGGGALAGIGPRERGAGFGFAEAVHGDKRVGLDRLEDSAGGGCFGEDSSGSASRLAMGKGIAALGIVG